MMRALIASTALAFALMATHAQPATVKPVTFDSQGRSLVGNLYLPDDYKDGQKLPGLVVTGAWTTVKEQMAGTYAAAMADRGYAALAFDFRGWGQSDGRIRYLENPERKTEDIHAAVHYLSRRPEVDGNRIGGFGICASAGYMSDVALNNDAVKSLALVAPWLHDAEIVKAVYGGDEGVSRLIQASRQAEQSPEPVIVEAASLTNDAAVMYQAPYYTQPDRGLIPEYDNKFNLASWEGWLTYDALQSADNLEKPVLLVHSEAAAIPQGAREYARRLGSHVVEVWLDDVTQFDFYDQPIPVKTSSDAVAEHFHTTLAATSSTANADIKDEAAIRTIIEGLGPLVDRGNFEAVEKLYADEIEMDYTSLNGGEVERTSPQALMTQWASFLPGFDRTRHVVSNIAVTLGGTRAEATAYGIADHYVDDLAWQVKGQYHYSLQKDAGTWRITSHRFTLEEESGTRDVFEPAIRQAAANPAAYIKRQQTEKAVRDFLTALEEKDMEKFAGVWAEDAVLEMPYAPEGFPERVAGREDLIKHYAAWPQNSGKADFTSQLVFHPLRDPERIFVEFKGAVEIVPTGRLYHQSYGGLFHVANGKIKLFREYFDPAPFKWAFGLDEGGSFQAGES